MNNLEWVTDREVIFFNLGKHKYYACISIGYFGISLGITRLIEGSTLGSKERCDFIFDGPTAREDAKEFLANMIAGYPKQKEPNETTN